MWLIFNMRQLASMVEKCLTTNETKNSIQSKTLIFVQWLILIFSCDLLYFQSYFLRINCFLNSYFSYGDPSIRVMVLLVQIVLYFLNSLVWFVLILWFSPLCILPFMMVSLSNNMWWILYSHITIFTGFRFIINM